VLAQFLKRIGIGLRFFKFLLQRGILHFNAFVLCGIVLVGR
jgi:hypothetical protein